MSRDSKDLGSSVFAFAEILQHYAQTGRTGLFSVQEKTHKSYVYLMSGIVAHAETEFLSGETAMYEILSWEKPEYEWEEGVTPSKMTMSGSVEDLVLRSIQMVNSGELEKIRKDSTQFQKTRSLTADKGNYAITLSVSSEELPSFDYEISTKQVRIGRHPENELVLPDTSVSRKHALVIINQDTLLIRDLGSMNGIKIDGQPLTQGLARDGQIINIGEVSLAVAITRIEQTATLGASVQS